MFKILSFLCLIVAIVHISTSTPVEQEFKCIDLTYTENNGDEISASYYLSNFLATVIDAQNACNNLIGGKLASIESKAENSAIVSLLRENGVKYAWTSGLYDPSAHQFIWRSTRQCLDYNNWKENTSTDFMKYACVGIENIDRGWFLHACEQKFNFICEM